MPSIVVVITSPSARNLPCATPTPSGVPVKMMSPVTSVVIERQEAHQGRHVEDQVGGVAVLAHLAVDRTDDVQGVAVGEFIGRDDHGADRAERVERLAEVEVRRLGRDLGRPIGDVLADRDADDVVPRVVDRDVAPTLADHDDEFAFVVAAVAADLDVARSARRGTTGTW